VRGLFERARRDPTGAIVIAALVLAVCLYAPTLARGLVNYDDPWLVADNWLVQHPSWDSLRTILFDLHSPKRFVLTPEYLPVRDLSMMLDFAVWGHWYPGFHITNLVIYCASIALWFGALSAFGIDRKVVAIAVLLWAVHPSHAESVAWITERKGLLAMMFAGACTLGYARYRSGSDLRWLVLAAACAAASVWSKAPGAFAIAALAGLELILPHRRASWRRSLAGLGTIAVVGALAFVPVLVLARSSAVVGDHVVMPASRLEAVLGVHGFYIEMAAMMMRNAVSYPISTHGPSAMQIALGAVALATLVAAVAIPRRGRWSPPAEVRAGAAIWLFGWLPVSHLVLPLQMIFVADRYMLFATLGTSLILAAGIARVPRPAVRNALLAVVVLAAGMRTLDAQSSWASSRTLWQRAVKSNPDDGNAWAMYVDAVVRTFETAGDHEQAEAVVAEALRHSEAPRLLFRQSLLVLGSDRPRGIELMRRAANGGEAIAMSNLALLLLDDPGKRDEALEWARRGVKLRPNAHAERTLGKVALAMHRNAEALTAFEAAYALEPLNLANRFNLGLALVELGRTADARAQFEACLGDPAIAPRAKAMLEQLPR
jgi:hypothetical protein